MKFQLKKYIYILNDITNTMLKQDKAEDKKKIKTLTLVLIAVIVILLVSLFFNVYTVVGK